MGGGSETSSSFGLRTAEHGVMGARGALRHGIKDQKDGMMGIGSMKTIALGARLRIF